MATAAMSDPIEIVDNLDIEQIRRELDVLEARQDALRILYRAARARKRKSEAAEQKGGTQ